MRKEECPAPVGETGGRGHVSGRNHYSSFPECRLHGCQIVERFPKGCPLAAENPADVFTVWVDREWQLRGQPWSYSSIAEANREHRAYKTCWACFEPLLKGPVVKRIRARDVGRSRVSVGEDLPQGTHTAKRPRSVRTARPGPRKTRKAVYVG